MLIFSLFKSAACHPTSSRSVLFYQLYKGAWRAKMKKHKIICFYYRKYYDTKCQLIHCSLTLLN